MAAKTPVSYGTAGWVDPILGAYVGPIATSEDYLTDGTYDPFARSKYTQREVFFSDIDDGDTWASGLPIVKCYWCGDEGVADACQASADANGLVTFETVSTSNISGFLLMLLDDPDGRYGKRIA